MAPRLEALPYEVVEEIALRLALRDRLAFLSSSRRLRSLSQSSQRVWAVVGVGLDGLGHEAASPQNCPAASLNAQQLAWLRRWLGSRQQLVRQLHVGAEPTPGSPFEQYALYLELVLLVHGLESDSLRSLQLECSVGSVHLGGWLAAQLPRLESLCVRVHNIYVEPTLGQLTRLTHLSLTRVAQDNNPYILSPGWLPPRLTSLVIRGFRGNLLPAQPLPLLRQLTVSFTSEADNEVAERGVAAQLAALTCLTSLAIDGVATHHPTPRQLAALTNLQWLQLGGMPPPEGSWSDLGPLQALQQLSHLSLRSWDLSSLPSTLLALPRLKTLLLPGNPLEEPLAFAPTCQVEELSITLRSAARSAAQLCVLPHLRSLCLEGWPLPEDTTEAEVEALLWGLAEMRNLEELALRYMEPPELFRSWRAAAACFALLRRGVRVLLPE